MAKQRSWLMERILRGQRLREEVEDELRREQLRKELKAARYASQAPESVGATRRKAWADFFTKYSPDLDVTPEGDLMTDPWRVKRFKQEFGITVVRTTMARQRSAALKKLRRR